MTAILRPALTLTVLFTLLLGLVYPLSVTGIAQLALPSAAGGSLVLSDGRVLGSNLVGQRFTSDRYFWPRPSATSDTPYNGGASAGTNFGPTSAKLKTMVEAEIATLRQSRITAPVPADAATFSGSGLDPDISPAFAKLQVPRIARARNLPEARLNELLDRHIQGRFLGLVGEPRVNVLSLNRALDADPEP
jgi:K+-transporting ATPase ATPase C chain